MELRKQMAGFGALLVAGHILLNAMGYSSPREAFSDLLRPENLVRMAVTMELGKPLSDSTVPPMPTVTVVTHTPQPTPSPTPQILDAIIAGGIRIDNATDYTIDTAQLLTEGPPQQPVKGHPQILIVHTHSSEAYTMDDFDRYTPSDTTRTQDTKYNVIRVGDVLTEALREYGLEVIHDRAIYDYPSYTGSYTRAGEAIQQYLEKYPSIAIVIDLHRDAIGDGDVVYKTIAEDENTPCAQTMFVVGTNASGLEHPKWEENLKLALYLQAAVHTAHPTLQRPIKLVRERYNQQLTTGSLILEVGSNGNTLAEALNAIEFFAEAAGPALASLVKNE